MTLRRLNAQTTAPTSTAQGRRFRVPRIAQRHPRVLLRNVETVPIALARVGAARAHITAAWPSGFEHVIGMRNPVADSILMAVLFPYVRFGA